MPPVYQGRQVWIQRTLTFLTASRRYEFRDGNLGLAQQVRQPQCGVMGRVPKK